MSGAGKIVYTLKNNVLEGGNVSARNLFISSVLERLDKKGKLVKVKEPVDLIYGVTKEAGNMIGDLQCCLKT